MEIGGFVGGIAGRIAASGTLCNVCRLKQFFSKLRTTVVTPKRPQDSHRHSVASQGTGIICPMSGVNSSLSHWPTRMKALGVFETSAGLTQTHSVASQETGIIYPMSCVSFSLSHWPTIMKALGVLETSAGHTQTQRRVPGDRNYISNVWCQFFFVPLTHNNEDIRCLRNVRRTHTDTAPRHRRLEYSRNRGLRSVLRPSGRFLCR